MKMSPVGAAAKPAHPMERHLVMSVEERRRLEVLSEVSAGRMSLRQAGEGLGLSYRQVRRGYPRYRRDGDWGLVHRLRGQRHRQWRERRAHLGERVPLDGSDHDWFERRRPRCVLMVAVADATNRTWAQFVEAETPAAS
ncbi:MAG: hypothetical protein KIT22_13750 [Verrucomicrobiae bacterium]|nr:hypothetical protein [Verrucomicrobiae bacterium]